MLSSHAHTSRTMQLYDRRYPWDNRSIIPETVDDPEPGTAGAWRLGWGDRIKIAHGGRNRRSGHASQL
jgi:hypothetical protein